MTKNYTLQTNENHQQQNPSILISDQLTRATRNLYSQATKKKNNQQKKLWFDSAKCTKWRKVSRSPDKEKRRIRTVQHTFIWRKDTSKVCSLLLKRKINSILKAECGNHKHNAKKELMERLVAYNHPIWLRYDMQLHRTAENTVLSELSWVNNITQSLCAYKWNRHPI